MGQITSSRIIVLIVCFFLAGSVVYSRTEQSPHVKTVQLHEVLSDIKGWNKSQFLTLDPEIVDALKLDDYININYFRGDEMASLYIGYYFSTGKIGASHSPLVCFPGQGWVLSDREAKTIQIEGNTINLEKMVATRGDRQELLIYWFQAYDKTSPGTFMQKVNNFLIKLKGDTGHNAFVRVTVPINNNDLARAYQTGVDYIKVFYPPFLQFIKT